jgi:NADPH2:quinone reductase
MKKKRSVNPVWSRYRIRQEAIGLNFVDTYFRDGRFPVKSFPYVPGVEAAGVIEGGRAMGYGV